MMAAYFDPVNEIYNIQDPFINGDLPRTPEVHMELVQTNGFYLKYIARLHMTPEICLAAVQNEPRALRYVEEQTEEICMAALRQDRLSIIDVHKELRPLLYVNPEFRNIILQKQALSPGPGLILQEPSNTIPFTQIQELTATNHIEDPLTLDSPNAGDIFAFFQKADKYYPIASFHTVKHLIQTKYKGSSLLSIFSPFHNIFISMKEVIWVKM